MTFRELSHSLRNSCEPVTAVKHVTQDSGHVLEQLSGPFRCSFCMKWECVLKTVVPNLFSMAIQIQIYLFSMW